MSLIARWKESGRDTLSRMTAREKLSLGMTAVASVVTAPLAYHYFSTGQYGKGAFAISHPCAPRTRKCRRCPTNARAGKGSRVAAITGSGRLIKTTVSYEHDHLTRRPQWTMR